MNKAPGTSTPTKPDAVYLRSPNQSARSRSIARVVLHYTTSRNLEGVTSWFLNPASRVSAHYVIARDGAIVQMVSDSAKAWHAYGENDDSIGIEICAEKGDRLTSEQTVTLVALLKWLLAEYHLDEDDITAHRFTKSNKGRTDCPGDLWKTEEELKSWVNYNVRASANIPDEPDPDEPSTGRPYAPCPLPILWPTTLERGDRNLNSVYQLQCALIGLGYMRMPKDGELVGDVFNEHVEYAVALFQGKQGLNPDGIVGPATRAAIGAALTRARAKMQPKTGVTRCVFSMDLEISRALRAGTLTFFDASGGIVRKEPATSGLPGFQTGDHLWTRGAGPVPPAPGQAIQFSNGYNLTTRGIEGMFFPMTPDPIMRNGAVGRAEIGLHRDSNVPGTAGCIGLLLSKADYNEFCAWARGLGTLPLEVKYT